MKFNRFIPLVLGLVLGSSPLANATLIGYWPMDETAGDIAADTISNRNGIWQNAGINHAWLPAGGVVGGAADLGGQTGGNNFFSVDLRGVLTESAGLTIALWVNPDGFTSSDYEGIFMTRLANPGPTGTAIGNSNWGLAWQSRTTAGNVSTGHLDSRTSTGNAAANNSLLATGGWYHVAVVWNGTTGTNTQYINGVQSAMVATGTGTISGGVWHLGNDSCCANRQFDGQMDDLAVWNEALTAQDIMDLFTLTRSPAVINPPDDLDMDGLPNAYEDMFPGFLDKTVADANQDVDRVGGVLAGALMPDGLTNTRERAFGTDPRDPDTDHDGLLDGAEVDTYFTMPLVADTDGDTILDGEEVVLGTDGYITNPLKADTDGDTINDNVELASMPPTDPTDPLSPPPPPLPSTGIVALYRFDETSGTIAADSAVEDGAQDATTTLGTVSWTAGRIGGAADFDGNAIMQAVDALGAGTTAFTISGWVNLDGQTGYRGIFMSRPENWGLATENGIPGARFDLRFDNAGAAAGSAGSDTPDGSATSNVWHHVAITWTSDGVNSTGVAYLNGVSYATTTTSAKVYAEEGVTWFIGSDSNRRLDGRIDEVSVWNVALSPTDISSIYRNGQLGIGLSTGAPVDFRITGFARNPDGTVTLTWNSHPFAPGTPDGEKRTYTVYFSTDLSTPRGSWADDSDGVISGGESTSFTTNTSFSALPAVWFYIQLNPK